MTTATALPLTISVVPWLLLAAGGPLLAALVGRWGPPALRAGSGPVGLLLGAVVVVRLALGFDLQHAGYQFGGRLAASLAWGVDGWSLAALLLLLFSAGIAGTLSEDRPETRPRLLVGGALGGLALCAVTLPALLLSLGGALVALGALGAVEGAALLLCVLGAAIEPTTPTQQLLAVPLLSLGLGVLAVRQPDRGGRAAAAAMLLRIATVGVAAVLAHARLVTAALPEGALIWTQVTSSVGALLCVGLGLGALGSRRLTGLATRGAAVLLAAAYTGLGAARLDAWSGLVLLTVIAGPAAGLILLADHGLAEPRWQRVRGEALRARLVLLGGLCMAGAPLTPGAAGWLLLALGAGQSPWWQSGWWAAGALLGAWLVGAGTLRVALALQRPASPCSPPPPRRMALLAGSLLVLGGLAPGVLLTVLDPASAQHLSRMVEAIGQLLEGTLGNLLPSGLKRWWL